MTVSNSGVGRPLVVLRIISWLTNAAAVTPCCDSLPDESSSGTEQLLLINIGTSVTDILD